MFYLSQSVRSCRMSYIDKFSYVCYYTYMNEIHIPITMTSKGTFTLPARVRKDFGLNKKGDRLMLRYQPGGRTAELQAPVDLRSLQAEIDKLIPDNVKPLKDVRAYLNKAKLEKNV